MLVVASSARAQQIQLTPQLGLGTLGPQAVDQTFETRTTGQLNDLKISTGTQGQALLLRKDRGPHVGRYAVLVTAPPSSGRYLMPFARQFTELQSYQLVGADKLGALPTVDVLGVHYIKVKPGQTAAFDKFVVDKLNPAVGNLRPDLRFLYYKTSEGAYICVVAITKASRDKYWPNGSDSDDLKTAFTAPVKALATELQAFLVDGTWGTGMTAQVYEAKEWADWVVVKSQKPEAKSQK